MTHALIRNRDWQDIVRRLGGAAAVAASARETKAFQRARGIKTASDLLRLMLSYCLGERGLRSTAAWAAAMGIADISNVALLYRLRQCGDWLTLLIGQTFFASPVYRTCRHWPLMPLRNRLPRLLRPRRPMAG